MCIHAFVGKPRSGGLKVPRVQNCHPECLHNWDVYIHIIHIHIPSGQIMPDIHTCCSLFICEQLCWLTAPLSLNAILDKCHECCQFCDLATSFCTCVWNQTGEHYPLCVFPCNGSCNIRYLQVVSGGCFKEVTDGVFVSLFHIHTRLGNGNTARHQIFEEHYFCGLAFYYFSRK